MKGDGHRERTAHANDPRRSKGLMVDWEFLAASMVAATRRPWRRSSSYVITITRCGERRPRLGLGHPHIGGNYQSTISA